MRDYISLTKPRITWLILMSTGVGYFFGLRGVSLWQIHWWALLHTVIGTGLIASGTAALNQWYEREADAKMHRTSHRPIPSGRLSANRALAFGMGLAIAGFVELAWFVNLLSGVLGIATLVSYLFFYTPLKQRSWLSTTVGAFPGAMPPMIGFAAASGTLTAEAWVLFAILFLWQFPHFYAIAWMYREDYARAGFRMMSSGDETGARSSSQSVLFCMLLLIVGGVPGYLGLTNAIYVPIAFALSGLFIAVAMQFHRKRTARAARALFIASIVYLPLVLGALVLTKT